MAGFCISLVIFLIAASTFISCENASNTSNSNGILLSTTTTTMPLPSSSSSSPEITQSPPDLIRQCACTESEECINKAWSQISTYQKSCHSHLDYFSNETETKVKCFVNDKSGGKFLNLCLQAFTACAMPKTSPKFIAKKIHVLVIRVKEHEMIESLKAFHICAGNFLKDNILQCFNEKKCGVSYVDFEDVEKLGNICPATKGYYYTISAKALPCLKHGIKPIEQTKV